MSATLADGRICAWALVLTALFCTELLPALRDVGADPAASLARHSAPLAGPARAVAGTTALIELLSPDLLDAGPADALLPSDARWLSAGHRPLHVGFLVLALALYAALFAPGRAAGWLRVAAAAAVIGIVLQLDLRSQLGLRLSLAALAGVGAQRLLTRPEAERGGPSEMLFGATLVIVAAGLALLAIQAGSAAEDGLARWIPRGSTLTRGELLATARQLQRSLDFAALGAVLAMGLLLSLLKNRGALGQLLLVLGVAVELSLLRPAVDALRGAF